MQISVHQIGSLGKKKPGASDSIVSSSIPCCLIPCLHLACCHWCLCNGKSGMADL